MEKIEVSRSGIPYLEITLERGSRGLMVWAKAHAEVEEFMQGLAGGKPAQSMNDIGGGSWFPFGATTELKGYYNKKLPNEGGEGYTLNAFGMPFQGEFGVNLSFLQLQGVSGPNGVMFRMDGPFLDDYVRELAMKISKGARTLIKNYIVPMKISVRVTTQEK